MCALGRCACDAGYEGARCERRTCALLAARLSPWGWLRAALMGAMLAAPPTLDPLAEGMAVLAANASALLEAPLDGRRFPRGFLVVLGGLGALVLLHGRG